MNSKIRVRLVPKTRDGRSIVADAFELTTTNAKANRPDRNRAAESLSRVRKLGLKAPRVTYHGSVEAKLSKKSVEELFETKLDFTSEPLLEGLRPITEVESEEAMPGRVNVNTASAEELEELPGIGSALASRIVKERKTAQFVRLSDLRRVSGIRKSILNKLRSTASTGFAPKTPPGKTRERVHLSNELRVPEQLRDLIAFAYIPTPVEYFVETYIPPDIENYHLRLQDVANALRTPSSHRNNWTGKGVQIAMTDTGFAPHPFFERQGYEIHRASTPSAPNPAVDTNGHGTGESANVLFMAPDGRFVGVKHNDYSAEALETALQQAPRIITNSWGWDIDYGTWAQLQAYDPNLYNELRDLENIINDAIDDGVLIVFAGGNGQHAFPASMPSVLAVGGVSVDRDGSLKASSYASSFRSKLYPGRTVPDVCGVVGEYTSDALLPGHIMLPVPEGCTLEGRNMPAGISPEGWGVFSGTSAASPQVAGIAALLYSATHDGYEHSPAEIKEILQQTATDVTTGTTGNGDTAVAGVDDATGAGFVNAAEACAFVANGTIEARLKSGVTDAWSDVTLSTEHRTAVAYFGAMQTFHGNNTAGVRFHHPTQSGCQVKIEEEQSIDAEIDHVAEEVGYLTVRPGFLYNAQSEPVGEVGVLRLRQPDRATWQTVTFKQRYVNPVVVAQIMTWNGTQPAHTRVRKVSASSCELKVEEWDYLNGIHPTETIAYLVMESGIHAFPNRSSIEAGSVSIDHQWSSVAFAGGFDSRPVVLSSSLTYKGDHAIVTRHRNVSDTGFDIRLQEEEGRDGTHRVEEVGWVAIEP